MIVSADTIADRLDRVEQLLGEIAERNAGITPRWFGVKGAAEYSSLGVKSIRTLISAGKLTAHRPLRGKILVDRLELDQLIAGSTSVPRKSRGRAPGTLKSIRSRETGEP